MLEGKKDKDLYTEDVIHPSLRHFPQDVNSLAVQLCLHKNRGLDELCHGESPGLDSCIACAGLGGGVLAPLNSRPQKSDVS